MTETTMINLQIDGKAVSVPKGTTVYQAATQLGVDIPIFCYQDRMPPFGACRMCLVEVEKMPKLQTSCTLQVSEGMIIKTQTEMAKQGREEILEFLLLNHPLDCPVCDRGGECPLQDITMKFGPGKSRFYEEKRHFEKPFDLSPVLVLDRERCITCARCTRFSDLIAGDHALEFIDRGYRTEVGTHGEVADSKFIGNTIMICPVGALTSRVYRFRARPWDNETRATTCTLCPVGCNMNVDSRDGEIMRTRSCENRDVNDIWLCDKGWFGYEFVDHPERLRYPLIRNKGQLIPTTWETALDLIAWNLRQAKDSDRVAGWGGNPLTVEENYLFQKLIRQGTNCNHLDHRIGVPLRGLEEECIAPGMDISIGEIESLSFAVLFGLDLTETFPVIWLRLRQAINCGAKVIFLGHYAPEIRPYLSEMHLHCPGGELEAAESLLSNLSELASNGAKGAFFFGSQYLDSDSRVAVLSTCKRWISQHQQVTINILEGSGNGLGARFAGMHPELAPGGNRLENPGLNAIEVLKKAGESGWDLLYVAGADPASVLPKKMWDAARQKLNFLVVQDLFMTETAMQADVVLPTLCFAEKRGTMINIEGRTQKIQVGKMIPEHLYSDGQIFTLLAQKLLISLSFDHDFARSLKQERVKFHSFPLSSKTEQVTESQATKKNTFSATFSHYLFDEGVRMQHNTRLSQLAKLPYIRINPSDGEKGGLCSNDFVAVTTKEGEAKGILDLDHTVAEGTVVLPLGFKGYGVENLASQLKPGIPVEVARSENHGE